MLASKNRSKKKILIAVTVTLAVILLLVLFCALYLNDYYSADTLAVEAFMNDADIEITTLRDGVTVFAPEEPMAGIIFYPGGKVDHTAYLPLMKSCASKGILCVLVEMPFRLAVLDINAADGIPESYPEIEDWYLMGHSLGGSMAASYLEKQTDAFKGLILLGSYSTADLSDTGLRVLSLYGSEDRVMDREKYQQNLGNLPSDFEEMIIEGGCHAYFGMYGAQKGDGMPSITAEEQILFTAEAVSRWIEETGD